MCGLQRKRQDTVHKYSPLHNSGPARAPTSRRGKWPDAAVVLPMAPRPGSNSWLRDDRSCKGYPYTFEGTTLPCGTAAIESHDGSQALDGSVLTTETEAIKRLSGSVVECRADRLAGQPDRCHRARNCPATDGGRALWRHGIGVRLPVRR